MKLFRVTGKINCSPNWWHEHLCGPSRRSHDGAGSRDRVDAHRKVLVLENEGRRDKRTETDGGFRRRLPTTGGCVCFATRCHPPTSDRLGEEESLTGRKTLISWRFHSSKHDTNLSLCHNASHHVMRKKNTRERDWVRSQMCANTIEYIHVSLCSLFTNKEVKKIKSVQIVKNFVTMFYYINNMSIIIIIIINKSVSLLGLNWRGNVILRKK